MATVIIFTKDADPYSVRAKSLLHRKGVDFIEKRLPGHADEMFRLTGEAAVTPQIVIDGTHIGGFEQLGSLELRGELDTLLEK